MFQRIVDPLDPLDRLVWHSWKNMDLRFLFCLWLRLLWCQMPSHNHELRTPREEIAFTVRPKIKSQIFRYGWSIFFHPHRPNSSDIFYLCLHWVSAVRDRIDSHDLIWRSDLPVVDCWITHNKGQGYRAFNGKLDDSYYLATLAIIHCAQYQFSRFFQLQTLPALSRQIYW